MVNFLVGVVVATMVLVPPLLFVIWMWRTDTRLLSRLLRQEREATRRMMRVRTVTPTPTQGTTTSATSEGRTITLTTGDNYEGMSTVDKIEHLHNKIVKLVSGYND
jgi:ribosomal protein S4E